jgi:predicted dehydrogenase
MKPCKWGIIGPGRIAAKFADALKKVEGAELFAVGSKDLGRAKSFSERYSAKKYYDDYVELAADPSVDAVYIATPHTYHHANAILCLRNKKAVLCEKPMSVTYQSTLEMVKAAKESDSFLMEAMWTRFLPAVDKALQLVASGEIGEIKSVQADFGVIFPFEPTSRIFDLALGGGALLDIGVYTLFLPLYVLGEPDAVKSFSHFAVTGADETTDAILYYKNGNIASIHTTVLTETPLVASITGTLGSISIQAPFYKAPGFVLTKNGEHQSGGKRFDLPYGDNGFEYEIREVMSCLEKGKKESDLLPLEYSLRSAKVVQQICDQNNLRYNLSR